ncbi:MAG: DUF4212 domain-containing protein [Pseudomonadota bacterium]
MIDRRERKPYWMHTKWQMFVSLVPYLLLVIVIPIYTDVLNSNKFLGYPLGFFMAGHGVIIIALFTVAGFVNRQDAVDRWHGASEDS